MHDLALYRKYRPKSWGEVIGQEHIVSVLQSSIKSDKVSHAYLFVGSRGTGKTTVARIFAKDIGISPNDIYEIDAASNRGIDDIKTLREGVRVLPFDSKYKVYIIDEVHMLSKDAWGALLKTLEEPPKHVIFILATTELQKVPDTIVSRCQVFSFKKASDVSLKNILMGVSKQEGYELDAGSLELITILGDGSFRDALGVLQKVLNSRGGKGSKKIKIEEIEEITGAPKSVLVNNFISAIASSDLAAGMKTVRKAADENLDMKLYLKLIIQKFRIGIIIRYAPNLAGEMAGEASEGDMKFLKDLNKVGFTSLNLAALLQAYRDIDRAFISSLPLELALIKILGQDI